MRYEEYLQVIEKEKEKLFAAADAVWDAAETAFSEEKSAEVLCRLLAEEGFAVTRPASAVAKPSASSANTSRIENSFFIYSPRNRINLSNTHHSV